MKVAVKLPCRYCGHHGNHTNMLCAYIQYSLKWEHKTYVGTVRVTTHGG